MQYCMRQEVDKAFRESESYRNCKNEYVKSVEVWVADKTKANDDVVQSWLDLRGNIFDSIVAPINKRYKARMTQLYNKKLKLESK